MLMVKCFKKVMEYVKIPEAYRKANAYGCDGASVNIVCNGLKGYFE